AIFVALSIALVVMVVNRVVFETAFATGNYCPSINPSYSPDFQTSDFCWPSGSYVEKDASYEITLATDGDWFDVTERGDVGGFDTDTLVHFSAMLLRRYWFEPWFKPIARIGEGGDDEYVLNPVNPFAAHRYKNTMCPAEPRWQPISGEKAACGMADDPTPTDRHTLVAKITARTSGELFLYVNDAVLAPPFDPKKYYSNNYGNAKVSVNRLYPDGTKQPVAQSIKAPPDTSGSLVKPAPPTQPACPEQSPAHSPPGSPAGAPPRTCQE
ncbi:MAG: hypothetical protein JWP80_2731, partial [Pseudomonas sp.]|nr:hypothetical protein [Pseudomonas sp.]